MENAINYRITEMDIEYESLLRSRNGLTQGLLLSGHVCFGDMPISLKSQYNARHSFKGNARASDADFSERESSVKWYAYRIHSSGFLTFSLRCSSQKGDTKMWMYSVFFFQTSTIYSFLSSYLSFFLLFLLFFMVLKLCGF